MNSSNEITTTRPTKSAKRLARDAKLAKQDANKRTQEERKAEVDKIMAKFQPSHLNALEDTDDLEVFLDDWIKND